MMAFLELSALAIVCFYVTARLITAARPARLLARLVLVSAAGWLTEETCIVFYGFYQYSPQWHLFLDKVPVLIVIIWPAVIDSARTLAAQLADNRPGLTPILTGTVVLADASLMEPIAVNAGLWSWNQPGLFEVPFIALLGWGVFAFLCTEVFDRTSPRGALRLNLGMLLVPPLGTHLFLLGSWWAALRWANLPIDPIYITTLAWMISSLLTFHILRRGIGGGVERATLLLRLPAVAFFLGLLCRTGPPVSLIIYIAAFPPPYLAIILEQHLAKAPDGLAKATLRRS